MSSSELLTGMTMLIAAPAGGQIVTNETAYTCPGPANTLCSFARTHNESLDVTVRSLTCTLPTSMGHWFDLSSDPDLATWYTTLKCVDFSIWSSSNAANQSIFVRVYQDLTPDRRGGACGVTNEPGPDVSSLVLLSEDVIVLPPSSEGVAGGSPGRVDGDRSVAVNGYDGGILLPPDAVIFIEVGHLGEAVNRFGCNVLGETGDAGDGPEQTWIKAPNCSGGGCVTAHPGDWVKHDEWLPTENRDFVMQVHLNRGDTTYPSCLCGFSLYCRQFDYTSDLPGVPDGRIGVAELLALLGNWGAQGPPRPVGDVAPFDCCGIRPNGDDSVDILDLSELLVVWGYLRGDCPAYADDCTTSYLWRWRRIREGVFRWDNRDAAAPDNVPARPDLGVGPYCGFDEDSGDVFGPGDLWYVYRPSCNGIATISTEGSDGIEDTIIEVWPEASCGLFDFADLLACSDDIGADQPLSALSFDCELRQAYLIRVAGRGGERGRGILSISLEPQGPDCNHDGVPDDCEQGVHANPDCNYNNVPDECDARGDFNGDGVVNAADLIVLLAAWGPCDFPCPPDTNDDRDVGITDLLTLLANWG